MVKYAHTYKAICQSGASGKYLGSIASVNSTSGIVTPKVGRVTPQTNHKTPLAIADTTIVRFGKGICISASLCINNLDLIKSSLSRFRQNFNPEGNTQ